MFIASALSFALLGVATLVALRLAYAHRRHPIDDAPRLIVTLVAWLSIYCGISLLITPFGTCAALLIFAMVVAKYRENERRALLSTLAVAAERGLPFPVAARAFAAHRTDEIGDRAWRLAELLEAGAPLAEAMRLSSNRLPADSTVLLSSAASSQGAAAALRASAAEGLTQADLGRVVFERSFYLLLVLSASQVIITFVLYRIAPTLHAIVEDFQVQRIPAVTQWLLDDSTDWINATWPMLFPLQFYLVIATFISGFFYAQGQLWLPPPFGWLVGNAHRPAVLRALAISVEEKMPIDEAAMRVARYHPSFTMQARMKRVVSHLQNGENWVDAMRRNRMLRQVDVTVLRAASRAGNLVWAMREVASSQERSFAYRCRLLLNVVGPFVIVVIGAVVAVLAAATFLPLISIIEELT